MHEMTGVNADRQREHGTLLPFTPLSLTFENIKYSVTMPKVIMIYCFMIHVSHTLIRKTKNFLLQIPQAIKVQGVSENRLELLKGVSGAFRPGVLTALMGVSGAGKTTLLDVLAGRKNSGFVEGNITISGYPKRQETFARVSGYCEQNDIHSPLVSVYESLLYSAWLRLPPEVDAKTREVVEIT